MHRKFYSMKGFDAIKYSSLVAEAVRYFWKSRKMASIKNTQSEKADVGARSGVTAGKHMDGFVKIVETMVNDLNCSEIEILKKSNDVTLPGYFRPTKKWDIILKQEGQLLSVIELKSQIGPSFGNNFNNRVEECIGSAVDFWKAYKEGAIGSQPEPFLGWIIYVEKTQESNSPVKNSSSHFPCLPEFKGTSYLDRYNLLCQKLVQERLYRCAALVASERNDTQYATYSDKSDILNLFKQLYFHLALSCAK